MVWRAQAGELTPGSPKRSTGHPSCEQDSGEPSVAGDSVLPEGSPGAAAQQLKNQPFDQPCVAAGLQPASQWKSSGQRFISASQPSDAKPAGTGEHGIEHHRNQMDVLMAVQCDGPLASHGLKLSDLRLDFQSQLFDKPCPPGMSRRQQ